MIFLSRIETYYTSLLIFVTPFSWQSDLAGFEIGPLTFLLVFTCKQKAII